MSPILLSGLLIGALAAALPSLLRLTGVRWLRLGAIPLATVLFATSFTLAGNGPLLRPLRAAVTAVETTLLRGASDTASVARAAPSWTSPPFDLQVGHGLGRGPAAEGMGAGTAYAFDRPPATWERIRGVPRFDGGERFVVLLRAHGGHRFLPRVRGDF